MKILRRLLIRALRFFAAAEPRIETLDSNRVDSLLKRLDTLQPADAPQAAYLARHRRRIAETLSVLPGTEAAKGRALELGSYLTMAWLLETELGYGRVACAALGPAGGKVNARLEMQPPYEREIDLFNVESDRFPYEDGTFQLVLCCELIEHLLRDPVHMLLEIRRVLAPGGLLLLTTPNASSLSSLANILYQVANPYTYSLYPPPGSLETGHVREFVPAEMQSLLEHCGFQVEQRVTRYHAGSESKHATILEMLRAWNLPAAERGDWMLFLARRGGKLPENPYPPSLFDCVERKPGHNI